MAESVVLPIFEGKGPRSNRYTDEHLAKLKLRLLAWLADGKSVRSFCAAEGAPHFSVIYDWLDKDPVFAKSFDQARRIGAENIAQQCLEIADQRNPLDDDDIAHRKLRIATRLQVLGLWFPALYGTKVAIGAAVDLPPLQLSDEQRVQRVQQLLMTIRQQPATPATQPAPLTPEEEAAIREMMR